MGGRWVDRAKELRIAEYPDLLGTAVELSMHPSLVPASVRQAADDHWRNMNIHRLDGTLWMAASCNIMLMRAARLLQVLQYFLAFITVLRGALKCSPKASHRGRTAHCSQSVCLFVPSVPPAAQQSTSHRKFNASGSIPSRLHSYIMFGCTGTDGLRSDHK